MKTATVVGAGIGGPAAAIMLDRAGYQVTLHEQRPGPLDYNSLHQLTLSEDTFGRLEQLGLYRHDLSRYDDGPVVQEVSDGETMIRHEDGFDPDVPNVMWNDLHDALVRKCSVTYGSAVTDLPDTDLVVWADGVGSVGRNFFSDRRGTYAGEMVFRGYAPHKSGNVTWYMSASRSPGYDLVSYPCWDRNNNPKRGWTLMLKNQHEAWDDTEILSPGQQERLEQACRPIMDDTPYRLISESEETTGSPQLVWPEVDRAVYHHNGSVHYIMGDALGTVSPRTALGANVAIAEAVNITMHPRTWDLRAVETANSALDLSREFIKNAFGW
jgi:2-polyprenyl-6-methoxyphenol hydroxylase-like FAD-dependent oxidoreductase